MLIFSTLKSISLRLEMLDAQLTWLFQTTVRNVVICSFWCNILNHDYES